MSSSFLHVPNISSLPPPLPVGEEPITYTFPLDPFQRWAAYAIHKNENVLVTAKTGSGKTLVAEYAIAYALQKGQRVFYTTPIKSLSNQKFHDLKHLFPHASVGILTGDIKSNPDAQIIVMTTEVLRNLLFKLGTATAHLGVAGVLSAEGLGLVVFDEVHYINDVDRGHVWEESLILLPPHIRLVMLSATIDQPEAFAAWIGTIKQVPCWLLATTYRIVPLTHAVWTEDGRGICLKSTDESPFDAEAYRGWLRSLQSQQKAAEDWQLQVRNAKAAKESAAGSTNKTTIKSFQHRINAAIETMAAKDLLPALVFSFSRKECERFADKVPGCLITSSEVADIQHILSFHLHRHMPVLEKLPQYHQIVGLLRRGIAFHHSGLLPLLKEAVELLFTRGLVKVLFCTESLAIGLNMPARTVVFTGLEKPAGGAEGTTGFRPLHHHEYMQMAGRAGRRGKDTRGYVFYLPAREPAAVETVREALGGALVPLQSRIQFGYDFVMKAIHGACMGVPGSGESGVTATRLLDASYWAVQRAAALAAAQADQRVAKAALEAAEAKLSKEQRYAFAERHGLLHQVKTLTNAKQKAAKLALKRWQEDHVGPTWTHAAKAWEHEMAAGAAHVAAVSATADIEDYSVADRLDPVLAALEEWGYITRHSASETEPVLTQRGVLATEVNEGNPFLMVELYMSGLLATASASEIVATLASMLEAERGIEVPEGATYPVPDAAEILQRAAKKGQEIERRHGVDPAVSWSITPFWSTLVGAWMDGEEAAVLTSTYGIYEGNLMRALLKCANLVNEWVSMATFCGDVGMLETLRDVPGQLLRGIAQPESLYLQL